MRVSVVLCRNVMLFVGLFNRITVCGTCVSVSTCRTWNAPPAAWSLSRPRILQASLPPPSPPADLAVYNRNPTALRALTHTPAQSSSCPLGPTLGVCLFPDCVSLSQNVRLTKAGTCSPVGPWRIMRYLWSEWPQLWVMGSKTLLFKVQEGSGSREGSGGTKGITVRCS